MLFEIYADVQRSFVQICSTAYRQYVLKWFIIKSGISLPTCASKFSDWVGKFKSESETFVLLGYTA